MTQVHVDDAHAAAAMLRWLVDAGCTSLVREEPVSWLTPAASRAPAPRNAVTSQVAPEFTPERVSPVASVPAATRPAVSAVAPVVASAAETLARQAQTLDELRQAIEAFEGCPIKEHAKRTVIADGNPESRVMLIGEAPGAEEDRTGRPFVGQAGKLLDRMLASIDRDRTNTYITNVFFWRPPGNRTPTTQEIALVQPFVRRHIELVRPRAILSLGGVSAKALLETETGITRLRGQWHSLYAGNLDIPVIATFHPANLLRQPANKAYVWRDLLAFARRIEADA